MPHLDGKIALALWAIAMLLCLVPELLAWDARQRRQRERKEIEDQFYRALDAKYPPTLTQEEAAALNAANWR